MSIYAAAPTSHAQVDIAIRAPSSVPQTAAPEMKNHLSTLPSIGAGCRFSCWGIGGSLDGSTRSADCGTVTLVLLNVSRVGVLDVEAQLTEKRLRVESCQ
jgi:hypothetical protein